MPTRQPDLLLDQIEIVEQPGLCWHDPLSRCDCGCHHVIGCQQNARIVRQPWQQPIRTRIWINFMLARQRDRVTLQLLDAEQLRTQQLRILIVP